MSCHKTFTVNSGMNPFDKFFWDSKMQLRNTMRDVGITIEDYDHRKQKKKKKRRKNQG